MMTVEIAERSTSPLTREDLADLFEQHNEALYRYAYRLLGDEDTAEECVSETFSRLIQTVKNGGGPGKNARAYLYRVAHNWITDFYRSTPAQEALEEETVVTVIANPAAVVTQRLEHERLRSALFQLTVEQRQVIVLRYLEQLSHEEVSAVIGKTAEATRALQHRAISTLRALLKEQEDSNGYAIAAQ